MCQLKAIVERPDGRETVMESVTSLEATQDGVILSTYFEEPLTIRGVRVSRIDFLGGAIVLAATDPPSLQRQTKDSDEGH